MTLRWVGALGYPGVVPLEWYVYVVRCRDGSLYTGITKDVARRLAEHDAGKGARYTRGRGPVTLRGRAGPFEKGDALRLEMTVKKASPDRKLSVLEQFEVAEETGR